MTYTKIMRSIDEKNAQTKREYLRRTIDQRAKTLVYAHHLTDADIRKMSQTYRHEDDVCNEVAEAAHITRCAAHAALEMRRQDRAQKT